MAKSLRELWGERPSFQRKRVSSSTPLGNQIVLGSVEEVREKARKLAEGPYADRLLRLYHAARRASEEAVSERERRDALWVLSFAVHARGKSSKKIARVLREKESRYAPWMS